MPETPDWIRLTDIYHAVTKRADGRVTTECGRWTDSADDYQTTDGYPGMHLACAECSRCLKRRRSASAVK